MLSHLPQSAGKSRHSNLLGHPAQAPVLMASQAFQQNLPAPIPLADPWPTESLPPSPQAHVQPTEVSHPSPRATTRPISLTIRYLLLPQTQPHSPWALTLEVSCYCIHDFS